MIDLEVIKDRKRGDRIVATINMKKNCIECGTLTYHCLLNVNGVCFNCIVSKTNYSGYWFGEKK